MDLGTIHARLSKGRYPSAEAVWADIQLVWRNCRTYNEAGSEVFKAAEELAGFAEQLWKQGRLPAVRCGTHYTLVAPLRHQLRRKCEACWHDSARFKPTVAATTNGCGILSVCSKSCCALQPAPQPSAGYGGPGFAAHPAAMLLHQQQQQHAALQQLMAGAAARCRRRQQPCISCQCRTVKSSTLPQIGGASESRRNPCHRKSDGQMRLMHPLGQSAKCVPWLQVVHFAVC